MVSRQAALREVAGWTALGLERGDFESSTGICPSDYEAMTERDRQAYRWAIEEVRRRLQNIGQRVSPTSEVPVEPEGNWVHGTRLGREHRSVRQHLIEDHGVESSQVTLLSDGGVHGLHDGRHHKVWSYAEDLPHLPPQAFAGGE